MITKSSLFLTKDNEHWYEETSEPCHNNGEFVGFNIYAEINNESVSDFQRDEEGMIIVFKGDSDLAKSLSEIRRLEWKVFMLRMLLKDLTDSSFINEYYWGSDLDAKIEQAIKI